MWTSFTSLRTTIVLAVSLLKFVNAEGLNERNRKLVILNVDATRWDYVHQPGLEGFRRLAENGSRAEYVIPIFPSNSYPNWYTMVTGLFAENHGFVENFMFDSNTGDMFLKYPHPNVSHEHWWSYAQPLWITAEKHGIKSALYGAYGCDVNINGKRATYCERHRHFPTLINMTQHAREAIDDIVEKFTHHNYSLAILHYSGVDKMGHLFGPDSELTRKAVRDADSLICELQDKLDNAGIIDEVNIVVISDHGMFDLGQAERLINMSTIVDEDDIKLFLELGSTAMILPEEGKLDKVFDDLVRANESYMQVYKKEDIPERYHIKNHHHTLPILLISDKKGFIYPFQNPSKAIPPIPAFSGYRIYNGFHGYDPDVSEEMRAIFYARGPAFKRRHVVPYLRMVDHYNVFCHILGISPLPNNGSWSRVQDMLII